MAWVLDHMADLEADFLRFYRVDIDDLDGPKFFRLVWRLSAYGGVIAMRLEEQKQGQHTPEQAAAADPGRAPARSGGAPQHMATFMVQHPDLIDKRKAL